ncbi:hypothetical protein [Streptomyces leeuwenhoekii]|uniref:Uncharacterized protein n=1 Tax=Streptomyces leeuwenhoekii TaxID=1437453 RepID=A0A0F7VQY0_STRLW|nr:hypothetical protein [Streptomyces leeuwenhoekii]KMS78168.1 hypothetical protein ACH49_17260 [Streptomyces leeuwenhoekii]CQR61008.1 Hypothetical Protein sle_15460 [Streptomyces leeuwenhoekii]
MFRQVPFHPVRQVGFIEKRGVHSEGSQHGQAETARGFGPPADGAAPANCAFDTDPQMECGHIQIQVEARLPTLA